MVGEAVSRGGGIECGQEGEGGNGGEVPDDTSCRCPSRIPVPKCLKGRLARVDDDARMLVANALPVGGANSAAIQEHIVDASKGKDMLGCGEGVDMRLARGQAEGIDVCGLVVHNVRAMMKPNPRGHHTRDAISDQSGGILGGGGCGEAHTEARRGLEVSGKGGGR